MSGSPRDLAAPELWEASLNRTRARRSTGGARSAAKHLNGPQPRNGPPHSAVRNISARGRAASLSSAAQSAGLAPMLRSRSLRPVRARTAPEIARARDLADADLWELSLGRSRARRRAAELRFVPTGSRAKRLSLGTLVALTVGPAANLGEATAAQHTGATAAPPPTTTEHQITLDAGSKGNQVRKLQEALGIKADGNFGPETQAAVFKYQATHGLGVDGIVGAKTSAALAAGVPAQAPSLEDSVMLVQAAVGVQADGDFGTATYTAIEAFQQSHGLNVDGTVGPETWAAMDMPNGPTLVPPASAIPPPPEPEPAPAQSAAGQGEASAGVARAASVDDPGYETDGNGGTTAVAQEDTTAPSSAVSTGGGESSGGTSDGVVSRVEAAANEIATRPYVYGGGHGSFESDGYDCSGSVSYALHGGGLISAPEDSTGLESYGEAGPGKHITIYANAEHAYMVVNGRRFDTVALAEHGSRWSSSPGDDGGDFVERHPAGE